MSRWQVVPCAVLTTLLLATGAAGEAAPDAAASKPGVAALLAEMRDRGRELDRRARELDERERSLGELEAEVDALLAELEEVRATVERRIATQIVAKMKHKESAAVLALIRRERALAMSRQVVHPLRGLPAKPAEGTP